MKNNWITKISAIVLASFIFFNSAKANETYATCYAGECEFLLSLWYDYAETLCMQTLVNEKVDTRPISFEIIETGQTCIVFNER